MKESCWGYLEVCGMYFKAPPNGIDGKFFRGFYAKTMKEFVEKHIAILGEESEIPIWLNYDVPHAEGEWDFWIDIDEYGQSLQEREEIEEDFFYEHKSGGQTEYFYLHPKGRLFPYIKGRYRSFEQHNQEEEESIIESFWNAYTKGTELEFIEIYIRGSRDLRGVKLDYFSKEEISSLSFHQVLYDEKTLWPEGFDPVKAGAVLKG